MPLKFNTANGAIIVSAEDGSGDAAVTFPRSGIVQPVHTGDVSITGDLTTTGAFDHTGAVDITGTTYVNGEFRSTHIRDTVYSFGFISGTVDVDLERGNVFMATAINGNTTFTFSNPPSGSIRSHGFTIVISIPFSSYTVTWPSSVKWAGGTAPDTPAVGEFDVLTFFNYGTGTYYGFQAGDAMS